jgi:putative ABC transport system ATP-binding protein
MDAAAVENVSKVYQKSRSAPVVHALRDVSVAIPAGQYVAIMGPSGSGKSTLMNLLGCLDRPTTGRYLLRGKDVAKLDDTELSQVRGKEIGFVFQAFNLIAQLTVLQNIEVPMFYLGVTRRERARRARASAERVGLGDRLHHRPSQLSGGQMQRVAIARALVNEPRIIMADEPTGNLDSTTGEAILTLFDELHGEGQTIIMVTHDDDVATRCQRVVRLRDGLIDTDEMVGKVMRSEAAI